jgi:hypothetical protein
VARLISTTDKASPTKNVLILRWLLRISRTLISSFRE